jgi:hypothetical protein
MAAATMPHRYSGRRAEGIGSDDLTDYRMLQRGKLIETRVLHTNASALLVFNFTKKEMLTS